MKCKIPEISWHNRDPVLSVDIQTQSENGTYRLASGGTDCHVLIWYVSFDSKNYDINLELAADLTRHQRAVNCVKWSPNGKFLASGDDESVIFVWQKKTENETPNILDDFSEQDKEMWITYKVLRGHVEDVYDLSWSSNSEFLVSGSVDNSAIIWDISKGKTVAILNEHKGFVQGVAWDPKNEYIATLSTDRYLRIFDIQTKRSLHRTYKGVQPIQNNNESSNREVRFFHDDTLQTYFRRLCFTPDGNFLITPAGVIDYGGDEPVLNATYVFSRYNLRQPVLVFPSQDEYAIAVRCCPVLFTLRPHNPLVNPPVVPLPYRVVIGVATRSSVYFYDTQQRQPFALISNIHYTRLTDMTWSSDGRLVVVSSTDGFCSLITFDALELGEEYKSSENELCLSNKENIIDKGKKVTTTKDIENECNNPPTERTCIQAIADKEILSFDHKFVTPEDGIRATPIVTRRYPRTFTTSDKADSKKPTQISTVEKAPLQLEEAMDAWPVDSLPQSATEKEITENSDKVSSDKVAEKSTLFNEESTQRTEDFRLVYEDTTEDGIPAK